jgi:hypothetical protein
MDPKFINTDLARNYFKKIEEMSDRELQELHAFHLSNIEKSNEKMRANIQFFFWFSLFCIVASIIIINSK